MAYFIVLNSYFPQPVPRLKVEFLFKNRRLKNTKYKMKNFPNSDHKPVPIIIDLPPTKADNLK